ncbi:MAG: hypothetical protein H0X66_14240 [Verrucomicrobia bacterium]|nr:hypothetical protein [Verrucomicrobiota bacterium]
MFGDAGKTIKLGVEPFDARWVIATMKNLFHLLILVLLVGCGTTKKETTVPPVADKNLSADRKTSKLYTLREMGVTMKVPAGIDYLNWSTNLFALLAHPLADASHGITIEGRRILSVDVPNTLVGNEESNDMQVWLNRFHTKLATNSERGFTYVRRDILIKNGDVLCMKAVVRPSPNHKQDVELAKRVIASVKLLKQGL